MRLVALGFMLMMGVAAYAQKTISEGTFTYDILIKPKNNTAQPTGNLNGAKTTIYIKGGLSRMDMVSALGAETTIYNAKIGNAIILKEYSGQKLMITLTSENWQSKNKKFEGIVFENTAETKVIEGYNCKRAFAKLSDGSSISVYYTPDLIVMNKEYSQAFKSLQGFPLEYEFTSDKLVFNYRISSIDFDPVPSSKFDFPKSGYRVMTYDENKREQGKGQ